MPPESPATDHHLARQLRWLGVRDEGDLILLETLAPEREGISYCALAASIMRAVTLVEDLSVPDRFHPEVRRPISYQGVYISVNPVVPEMAAMLPPNAWVVMPKGVVTDARMASRRAFYIDVDTSRPNDLPISTTEVELRATMVRTKIINDDLRVALKTLGRSDEDVTALLGKMMSGNGFQTWVKADLPNTDETRDALKELLAILALLYNAREAHIDESVFDAKRIGPAAGSRKRKAFEIIDPNNPANSRVYRQVAWQSTPTAAPGITQIELNQLVAYFRARLTPEQQEVRAKAASTSSTKAPPKSLGPTDSTGSSNFHLCNAVPILDVGSKLGMDLKSPTCPWCNRAGSASVFLEDSNRHHCSTNTCSARGPKGGGNATGIDLVAKVKHGIDKLDTKAHAPHLSEIFAWFSDECGVAIKRGPGRPAAAKAPPAPPNAPTPDDPRPIIQITTDTHLALDAAIAAIASARSSNVYVRGGLVQVIPHGDNGLHAANLTTSIIQQRTLSESARFEECRNPKFGWTLVPPPKDLAAAVATEGTWAGIRRLAGITEVPCLRKDGTLITQAGYDEATCLLYLPSAEYPQIDEEVTRQDALVARDALLDLVAEFPWAGTEDEQRIGKGVWLANVLTPFARMLYDGPSPGFLYSANNNRSGKSFLAKAVLEVVMGSSPTRTTTTETEELRKAITTAIRGGRALELFDNLPNGCKFGGGMLDKLLTDDTWTDRMLGGNTDIVAKNRTCWMWTGNNVEVDEDTQRRILHARLDRASDDRGREYKIPDFLGHIKTNRVKYVTACLVILRAWVRAGRADGAPKMVLLESFESWSKVVGRCVNWLGMGDVTTSQRIHVATMGDSSTVMGLAELLDAWVDAFRDKPQTIGGLLKLIRTEDEEYKAQKPTMGGAKTPREHDALRDALVNFAGYNGQMPNQWALSKSLKKAIGKRIGARSFAVHPQKSHNADQWHVLGVPPPTEEEIRAAQAKEEERARMAQLGESLRDLV